MLLEFLKLMNELLYNFLKKLNSKYKYKSYTIKQRHLQFLVKETLEDRCTTFSWFESQFKRGGGPNRANLCDSFIWHFLQFSTLLPDIPLVVGPTIYWRKANQEVEGGWLLWLLFFLVDLNSIYKSVVPC